MKITKEYKEVLRKKYRFNKSVKVLNDIPYIGYNHVVKAREGFDEGVTRREALIIFNKDVLVIEKFLNRNLNREIPQRHFDIMVSLCYDIGTKAFKNSLFFNLYLLGELKEAFKHYLVWGKSKGEPSQSLSNRRKDELKYIYYTV